MNVPSSLIASFIAAERLPPAFAETARRFFVPLARRIANCRANAARPLLIGINGAQGSGKSTLAAFLARLLGDVHGLKVVPLSIDDFYLTRAERRALAQQVHPLLETRGVPGTHDVGLASDVIDRLMTARDGADTNVPRFDKAMDDRAPETGWERVAGPVDLVILEGWCVGARPEPGVALLAPVNQLEAEEDPEGTWRTFVNDQLKTSYAGLFDRIDHLLMLRVPDFECVYDWRLLQEEKLRETISNTPGASKEALMGARDLARFIRHYERLTRHTLNEMPARADMVFELDRAHQVTGVTGSLGGSLRVRP